MVGPPKAPTSDMLAAAVQNSPACGLKHPGFHAVLAIGFQP
jgi:hypothetical protein